MGYSPLGRKELDTNEATFSSAFKSVAEPETTEQPNKNKSV